MTSSDSTDLKKTENKIDRRSFISGLTTAGLGLTIVPAHVLGGPTHIAPSDKINVAYIGLGTQGLRQLQDLIEIPDVQITALCDPQRKAIGYYDWSPTGLLEQIRNLIGNPNWNTGGNNTIPGGLDNGKDIVEAYYAKLNSRPRYKGCKAYTDFRELFAKERGIDAVQIMTTDHMHGIISATALKRNIAVTMHKPIANRLIEGRKVINLAEQSNAVTHLMPWDSNGSMDQIMIWINSGAIGE